MSRLYTRTHLDNKDKPDISRSHTKVATVHAWGTASDNKKAVAITTRWDKEAIKPTVIVELQQDVAYEVIGPKGNTIALSR